MSETCHSASAATLDLSQVTLCAASSVNVKATLRALEISFAHIDFGCCKFFTDAPVKSDSSAIEIVSIPRLSSSKEYSHFLLSQMVNHIETSHCLVIQWDGHVIDARRWLPTFLNYDYIGASWPQFNDGFDVGNGGFSLRSRRLMKACQSKDFQLAHPEDIAIGRINREWLEERGLKFAPRALADRFATERAGDLGCSFGYHGVWNMPHAIGADAFWEVYRELDDRSTISHNLRDIVKDVVRTPAGLSRVGRMLVDHLQRRLVAGSSRLAFRA